jgi:hypothetical protein
VLTWYWYRMLLWIAASVRKTAYIGNRIPQALKTSICKIHQGENQFGKDTGRLNCEVWTATIRESNAYSSKCKWIVLCSAGDCSEKMSRKHKGCNLQQKSWRNSPSINLSFYCMAVGVLAHIIATKQLFSTFNLTDSRAAWMNQ